MGRETAEKGRVVTCKHPKREWHTYRYTYDGQPHEHTECLVCGEVMPLGPANDTLNAGLEILAAEFALGDVDVFGDVGHLALAILGHTEGK